MGQFIMTEEEIIKLLHDRQILTTKRSDGYRIGAFRKIDKEILISEEEMDAINRLGKIYSINAGFNGESHNLWIEIKRD